METVQAEAVRVSVKDAAKELNVSEQFVRIAMQQGKLPIGIAIKLTGERFTYLITRSKLDNFINDHGAWNSTERKEDTYETN